MDSATGKVGKVSRVAEALPHSEGAPYKRQGREVAACLRDRRARSALLPYLTAVPRVHDMNPLVERVMGPMLTVHQWLYEHSDGRIGASLGGRPMLLLRTVGRRTGQPRTSALLYVRDGDACVVI